MILFKGGGVVAGANAGIYGHLVELMHIMKLDESSCPIHCWQRSDVAILFRYSKSTVSLNYIQSFIECELVSRKISCKSFKMYFLSSENSWSNKIKIDSDQSIRRYLEQLRNDMTRTSKIMVSIGVESPRKSPEEVDKVSTITNGEYSSSRSIQNYFHDCVLKRDSSMCVFVDVLMWHY